MSISIQTAYKTNVVVRYGNLLLVINWCKENCDCEWRLEEGEFDKELHSPTWDFYFESERDYINFILCQK